MAGGTALPSSKPSYLPKAPPLNTVILELQPVDLRRTQNLVHTRVILGFPGGSVGKDLPAKAGDAGLIPGLGRSPGGGNGNPLQYSCLEIPWTEEPGGLQSTGSQKSPTQFNN